MEVYEGMWPVSQPCYQMQPPQMYSQYPMGYQSYNQPFNQFIDQPVNQQIVDLPHVNHSQQSSSSISPCSNMEPDSTTSGLLNDHAASMSDESSVASTSRGASSSTTRTRKDKPRIRQPVNSNAKERRRNVAINEAFDQLQGMIPALPTNRKLPKIKTLRLTARYIEYLRAILREDDARRANAQNDEPEPITNQFGMIVSAEVQMRNSYKERAEHEMLYGSDNRPNVSLWQQ